MLGARYRSAVQKMALPLSDISKQDPFVVAYTGAKMRYLLRRAVPMFLIFSCLLALYMNDSGRRFLNEGRDAPADALGLSILSLFVFAAILDMALTLATFRRGRPALVVDAAGVVGAVLYRKQRLSWDMIADVFVDGPDFLIERKPVGLIEGFSARFSRRGSRHRVTQTMRIPLRCVDKTAAEIETAIRRAAPAGFFERIEKTGPSRCPTGLMR